MSSDAFSEAMHGSLTKNLRCWTSLGSLQRPKSPSWTKGKGKEGRVREKKGWDEREKEEGEEREGDTVSQLQFLDPLLSHSFNSN